MPSVIWKRKKLFKLGSSIDQGKIEFVKKSKVTNDGKSKEVSFLFLYYLKLWHNKAGPLKTLDIYTYLCRYILSYLAQRILVNHSKRLHYCCR